jgi:hypothetical protein
MAIGLSGAGVADKRLVRDSGPDIAAFVALFRMSIIDGGLF